MILPFVKYSMETGRILAYMQAPEAMISQQLGFGEGFLIVQNSIDNGLYYIQQGEVTQRPTQSTVIDKTAMQADGLDVITLTGVPNNATFTATNQATLESVTGPISGSDTFFTTVPGKITLKVTCWPYLDWEQTINAV